MRGERQQVHLQRGDVERDLPCRLGRIGVEDDAALARDRADFGERLQHPDLVVGRHHRHQDGAVGQHRPEFIEIDEPFRVNRQPGDAKAVALEPLEGVEHRLVLGRHRDQVIAALAQRVGRALDRQVVRLGRAAREADFSGASADQLGDLNPRRIHGVLGIPPVLVLAACRIAEALREIRQHGLEHAGIDGGGGVIVEADRAGHGLMNVTQV